MDSLETTFITHFQPLLNGATQGRRYRELIQNQIQCFITPRKLKLYRGYLGSEANPGNRVFNGIYGEQYKSFAIQNLKELANTFMRIAWSYHSETVWFWADQWLQFSTEAWEDKRDKVGGDKYRLARVEAFLWQGNVMAAIAEFDGWSHPQVDNFIAYLRKHQPRIPDYWYFQTEQISSIGSGAIESTVKQIGRRVKISGAQWHKQNVPQVLFHRTAYLNGMLSTTGYLQK